MDSLTWIAVASIVMAGVTTDVCLVFPAIDAVQSGTRREELLIPADKLDRIAGDAAPRDAPADDEHIERAVLEGGEPARSRTQRGGHGSTQVRHRGNMGDSTAGSRRAPRDSFGP